MYSLGIVLFAIAVKLASCRPNGASPVSCTTMEPSHLSIFGEIVEGQLFASPYRFTAMWDKRMKIIRIFVSGERVQGFLIQGRLEKSGPAVGRFINITENPDATYQNCSSFTEFGAQSSVTHRNREYQDRLELFWEPPTNVSNRNYVTFYATLAKNKVEFWIRQESNTLPLNMDVAPDMTTPTTVAATKKLTLTTKSGSKASVPAHVLLQCTVLFFTTLVLLSN